MDENPYESPGAVVDGEPERSTSTWLEAIDKLVVKGAMALFALAAIVLIAAGLFTLPVGGAAAGSLEIVVGSAIALVILLVAVQSRGEP